jgi:threonine synthase
LTPAIRCTVCKRPYPDTGLPYRCPHCLGLFDFAADWQYDPTALDDAAPGIWRWGNLPDELGDAPLVSLGEGGTPLEARQAAGRDIFFKLESNNPTGCVTDRAAAALVAFLAGRGAQEVVDDSSGRSGLSLARYAAQAGMQAHIYLPDAAPAPVRQAIETAGAQATRIMGPRSNAARAVQRAVDEGAVYASHVYLPHGLTGLATLAYELVEQLGKAPGAVIVPVGQGLLFLALQRGFEALRQAGVIQSAPRLVGAQPLACAPLWALFTYGAAGLSLAAEGRTLAQRAQVIHPVRGDAVMQAVAAGGHILVAVDEARLAAGRQALSEIGIAADPTAALIWDALEQTAEELEGPIVAVITARDV